MVYILCCRLSVLTLRLLHTKWFFVVSHLCCSGFGDLEDLTISSLKVRIMSVFDLCFTSSRVLTVFV